MNLVLVLDGRAKTRQITTRLVREAGHRAVAAADAALAADLVLEHASEIRLIAANADDPDAAELQRWIEEAGPRPRPTMLLYDASGPTQPLEVALGLTRTGPIERELANTLRPLQTAEAEREQLMVRLVGAEEAVHRVTLSIEAAIGRLRRLVFELNPPNLAVSTLGQALQSYMVEYARETPVGWKVADRLRDQPTEQLKQIMFRVAQEALRNVRKHADAHRVEILLAPASEGLLLQVRDDGVGFVPEEAWQARAGHIGMPSMRERLQRAGGWLEIRRAPGAGAVVEAWLPATPVNGCQVVDEPRSLAEGGRLVR